jgi:hypothetical protein
MSLSDFIKQFGLKQTTLEISKYEVKNGMIVIKEIKVLDDSGEFIRFADLNKVLPYLKFSNVKFN